MGLKWDLRAVPAICVDENTTYKEQHGPDKDLFMGELRDNE